MLREFAKLSGGMLFLHGHIADPETARVLARTQNPSHRPRNGRRARVVRNGDVRIYLVLVLLAAFRGGTFLFQRESRPQAKLVACKPDGDLRNHADAQRRRNPWSRAGGDPAGAIGITARYTPLSLHG